MSGRKTTYTTISSDELRHLRERAAQATSLKESNKALNMLSQKNGAAMLEYQNRINSLNNSLQNLNHKIDAQATAASKEEQELRIQLQKAIGDSNLRIKEESDKCEERIKEMHMNFSRELSKTKSTFTDALSQTRADVNEAMRANYESIEKAMEQNNNQMRAEIEDSESRMKKVMNDVSDRLDNAEDSIMVMEENHKVLLGMAKEYEKTLCSLIDDIEDNYRVGFLLCASRINEVKRMKMSCHREILDAENISANAPAARLEARHAVEEAISLRQDVIRTEQEWNVHLEAARQMLGVVSAQLEASKEIDLPEEGFKVDVDSWTHGDLSAIKKRIDTLNDTLDKASEEAHFQTTKELDGIKSAGLQISKEIDEVSMFAVEAAYASQDRADRSQDIADKLYDKGLNVVNCCYRGNDQRSALRLHLRNDSTGFEIIITQTPKLNSSGIIENILESDIINYGSYNQEYGDKIAKEVLSSLSFEGIEQGEVMTVPGFENKPSNRIEVVDIEKWETECTPEAEVVKPVHQEVQGVL